MLFSRCVVTLYPFKHTSWLTRMDYNRILLPVMVHVTVRWIGTSMLLLWCSSENLCHYGASDIREIAITVYLGLDIAGIIKTSGIVIHSHVVVDVHQFFTECASLNVLWVRFIVAKATSFWYVVSHIKWRASCILLRWLNASYVQVFLRKHVIGNRGNHYCTWFFATDPWLRVTSNLW